MIKKLLSASLILSSAWTFAQDLNIKTQQETLGSEIFSRPTVQSQGKSASLSTNDTLWYFYSKHRFRNLGGTGQNFYTVKTAANTSTAISTIEYGNSFLNGTASNSAAVTVNGAFILVSRQANSTNTAVPIMVYLYNANPAGQPTTKVDSVSAVVTNTNGVFNYYAFTSPKTVNSSFFVSYKLTSTTPGDTIRAWMTSARTATSSAAANQKFGEGLAYTRVVAAPSTNTIVVNTNLYGSGFDIESVIAPAVSFSINTNYTVSAPNSTVSGSYCNGLPITFTNTTYPASIMYNRQFNFNKFIPYWAPYSFTVQPNAPDSIVNWVFSNAPTTTVNTMNASNTVASPGTFTTTLTMKYRPAPFLTVQKPSFSDMQTGTYTVVVCSVGLQENNLNSNAIVYPNPTVNGKTTIAGLEGTNTITVYNMIGQVVSTQVTETEVVSVDLSNQAAGNYLVRITNSNNQTKTIKVINQ